MIRLAYPAYLLVAGLFLVPLLLRPRRAWQYSSLSILPTKHWSVATVLTAAITSSALALLLVALARPQSHTAYTEQVVEVRDIVLTLDLSYSMESALSYGMERNHIRKLDLVQQAALTLVQRRPHDRLGLIVFGDEAFGVWPLSTMHSTIERRLQRLATLLPTDLRGTHVINAVEKSLDHLQELGQARTRLVVLFTDGLDTIDPATEQRLLQRMRHEHVALYILGMQLGEDARLINLTRQSQGRYFNITNPDELDHALRDIDRLETSQVTVRREAEPQDLYAFFAVPGLLFLTGSLILRSTWTVDI